MLVLPMRRWIYKEREWLISHTLIPSFNLIDAFLTAFILPAPILDYDRLRGPQLFLTSSYIRYPSILQPLLILVTFRIRLRRRLLSCCSGGSNYDSLLVCP